MPRTGRPRGSGARYVRLKLNANGNAAVSTSNALFIGRALWQEVGESDRVQLRRNRPQEPHTVYIIPCQEPYGYRVSRPPDGMPKIGIGHDTVAGFGLLEGKFAALVISSGIIMFDLTERIEDGKQD